MAPDQSLADRIKAEFAARDVRAKTQAQTRAEEAERNEQGIARFGQVCEDLKSVWGPKFEEFAKQFGDQIKVTPSITPSQREAKISFMTNMANITLTLTASPNADVTQLVLDYDLLIIPMYFEYERHARLEMPLDKIDRGAVGKWIDNQMVSCVRTYLSLQENELYLQRAMVEDPVTKTKFLPSDAKATFEHAGKTYYFSSEESFKKFKTEKTGAAATEVKPAAAAAKSPQKPA